MSLRPFRDIHRKKTKVINVGDVKIGGDNPISVQSMTNTQPQIFKQPLNKLMIFMKRALILLGFLVQMKNLL